MGCPKLEVLFRDEFFLIRDDVNNIKKVKDISVCHLGACNPNAWNPWSFHEITIECTGRTGGPHPPSTGNQWSYQWCVPCPVKHISVCRHGACNPNPWNPWSAAEHAIGYAERLVGVAPSATDNQWIYQWTELGDSEIGLGIPQGSCFQNCPHATDGAAELQSQSSLRRSMRAVFGPFVSAVLAKYG